MTLKHNFPARGILSIAALAVISMSPALQAQYRVGNDGHARDANNRVGSGGYNAGGSASPYAINGNAIGNNIVTGNVTGGREFRGFVPYTAAGAFSAPIAGTNVDRFVSQSAGVPIDGIYNNNNAQNVLPYYGQSYGAPPPSGISGVQTSSGQYLPAIPMTRTLGDVRLGNPFSTVTIEQPRPGQTVLPGPVDTSQQPTIITASPLYGVRLWHPGDAGDQQFLSNYTDVFSSNNSTQKIEPQTLEQMRNELGGPNTSQPKLPTQPNQNGNNPNGTNPTGDNTNQSVDQGDMNKPSQRSFDSSVSSSQNQPLDSTTANNGISGGVRTGETGGNRLSTNVPTLANTSPQYRELQARFQQYKVGSSQMAEVEQNRELREQQRAIAQLKGNNKEPGNNQPGNNQPGNNQPGMNAPGANAPAANAPGATPTPGAAPVTPAVPAVPGAGDTTPPTPMPTATAHPKEKPLQINSFAKDMKQSGAAELMKQAEDDMHNGKFTRALDKYDMVEQVTPNDPLVSLGRATAELGSSYYTRADAHLRDAFTRNQELLLGQYDLHTMLGEDRLQFLVRDLKDLAVKNKQDSRYPFLLAYIAYNTGNEKNASAYLDLADKRAGGKDPFFKLVRSRWSLPDDAAPDANGDMNK